MPDTSVLNHCRLSLQTSARRVPLTAGYRADLDGQIALREVMLDVIVSASYDGYGRLPTYTRTGDPAQANAYSGLDDRVSATSGSVTHSFVYEATAG